MRSMRAYCRTTFLTIGLLSGVVALLNWLCDPYHAYRHPFSESLRPFKRRIIHRVAKAEIARRESHEVILLGDSRVAAGFDTGHPALTKYGSVYNLSMAASSVYEQVRMLELVLQNESSPKLVIWGICPEFVPRDRCPRTEFDFDSSLLNPQLSCVEYHWRNLLSIDATRHSMWVLRDSLFSERKQFEATNAAHGGFTSKEALVSEIVSHEVFIERLPARGSYLVESEPLPQVAELEQPLRNCFQRCRELGIELKIVIPPDHSVYVERLCQLGLRERVEMGKRVLVQFAAEANLSDSTAVNIEVWDFTAFTGPCAEQYPSPNRWSAMHWYQDAQHFRRNLGNLVLNQMFNLPNDGPNFGTMLTVANIEEHLANQRVARDAYCRRNVEHVQLAKDGPIMRR
jgi:hypothetical protein